MSAGHRWNAFDLAEAFHLAHAVEALERGGVFQALATPQTAEQLAAQHGFDLAFLHVVLLYVAERTDLLQTQGQQFVASARCDAEARFVSAQYIGAYGPNARALSALLREPTQGGALVDRAAYARAHANMADTAVRGLSDIIRQTGLSRVLDLGCGPGSLLIRLARDSADFVGWGVDLSPEMCATARERLRAAGLQERIQIFEGDFAQLEHVLPGRVQAQVKAVSASGVLNEFFGAGDGFLVDWLKRLRVLLPGRTLVVGDYYGQIGRRPPPWTARVALHDFVSLLSGQGVPPSDLAGWRRLYEVAGCTLTHLAEDEAKTGFVHVLSL